MRTIERNGTQITFDEELALQWIEALESGEYRQGVQRLRPTTNTFCCLGVLCDVIDPSGWGTTFDPSRADLPWSVADRIGITQNSNRLDNGKWEGLGEFQLWVANDIGKKSFADIAAALRDYYGFPPKTEQAVAE